MAIITKAKAKGAKINLQESVAVLRALKVSQETFKSENGGEFHKLFQDGKNVGSLFLQAQPAISFTDILKKQTGAYKAVIDSTATLNKIFNGGQVNVILNSRNHLVISGFVKTMDKVQF